MADITSQLEFATTPPAEAIKNIDSARAFDMGPDQYVEHKPYMQTEAELLKLNTKVTKGVAEYSSISSQHSSLVKNDSLKLSQVENLFTQGKEKVDGTDITQKIQALEMKEKTKPADFSEDDAVNLMTLRDEFNARKDFKVDKPGKNDQIVNKYFETQKKTNFIQDAMNSISGGLSSVLATGAQTPQLLYDAYFYPANLLRNFNGEPEIQAPEFLKNNPVAQHYTELSKQFYNLVPQMTKDMTDSIARGDFAEAGEIGALKFLNNFPNQAAILAATVAGGPAAGMAVAGVSTAAQSNAENQAKGLTPTQSLPNALAKGTIESAFERFGTIGMFKSWETALTTSFGKDNARQVLTNMFKSLFHSSFGEGIEEGATSAAQDLTDYVSGVNPDALKGIGGRAVESAAVGFISGGLLTAPASIAKAKSNIYQYGEVQDGKRKAVDLLNFDSDVTNAISILKETDMGKMSTPETSQFMKTLFKNIGLENVYLDKEQLQKWANNPEKALAVRNIIDPSGEAAAALNAPIKVPAHEFFALTFEYPDLQPQYKLSPEAASVQQAEEFLNSVSEANDKRQNVLKVLEAPDAKPEDLKMIDEALNTEQPSAIYPSNEVYGEDQYLDLTKMEDALKGVMPESERTKYLEDQLKSRQEIVDNINETGNYEMEQVVDVGTTEALVAEQEAQLQRLENNPDLATVDRFVNPQNIPFDNVLQSLEGVQNTHEKPGFSPVAIDPSTLPESLKDLKSNARLKSHKVFVKGGINVNDAAALLGYTDAATLLNTLASTPSREEIATQRTEARKADIEREVRDQVGLNETGITKAYERRLTNAIETMKIMKDKFWSSTKTGMKRIALTPLVARTVMAEAKATIIKSKVKDLNVNQFKVGERKSERLAWDAITKNQVEKAYINQKAVIKNIALTNETQQAIAKVNRVVRFARKFNKASVIQELKDAGPLYLEAANEILETFNLTTRKSDVAEKDSFKKWAEMVAKNGQGNFVVPERLKDQRQNLGEMTVEQVLSAGSLLQGILHTAKYKNKLFRKHEAIKGLQTIENIGNLVEENARKNFDYNPDKTKTFQKSQLGAFEKAGEILLGAKNYLERAQHLITKLDDGKAVGFFNDLLWRPLVDASNNKKTLTEETRVQMQKIIEGFGKSEFENLANEFVTVPEFVSIPGFKNGNVSKADLLAMELNFGNEGNIQELEKFGGTNVDGSPKINRDVIRKVLDRELQHKHTALAQNIWNIYKSFEPKMKELQKRTEGNDNVEWVQGKPFVARGKEYPGGYYPIARLADKAKIASRKAGGLQLQKLENFKLNYYGDAMTEQGHLIAREGNDDVLDLDLSIIGYSINQTLHDLTHREVLADGVKMLGDKKIRDNIVSVIGKDGYANIVDTYISVAQEVENDSYGTNDFLKIVNGFANGMQVVAIGGKLTSVMIQPASVLVALDKMGKAESTPFFLKTVTDISKNPGLIPAFYNFAEEINPAIRDFTEDVSKNSSSALNGLMPEKGNILSPIKGTSEFITNAAFMGLSQMDRLNKVLVTITAYRMAMEGKVKGLEHLKGDYEGSTKYASNMSELTQTHNDIRNLPPAQKNKYIKPFLYFYNDLNNLFNNILARSREVRKEFSKGNKWRGTTTTMSFVMTLALLKLYENSIRGQPFPGDGEDGEELKGQALVKAWSKFLLWQPIESFIGTLPLGRDVAYAVNKKWEKRKIVQIPLESALSDIATSISALVDFAEMIDEGKELTAQQRKAMWYSAGILTKLPTGAIYQQFIREKRDEEYLQKGLLDRLSQVTRSIVQNPDITADFKKDLEKLEAQLNPKAVQVSKGTYATMKEVMSQSNPTAFNEENGAAGIYQFTETAWNNIMEQAPELGLTENGRVMQKVEQQQKAFEYETKKNGEVLRAAGLEVSTENIYAAHILGSLKTSQILTSKDDTKLNTLVDANTLKSYGIQDTMTVGGFKDWLIFKVVEAEERLTNKPKE